MKKIFLSILLLLGIKLSAQCTLSFSITTTPETCTGCCDGSAQISNLSGGCPAYSVMWSNGANTFSISNLCAGSYTATVMDGGCCAATPMVCGIGSTTGFHSLNQLPDLIMFPNPASGHLTIRASALQNIDVKITESSGKQILNKILDVKNGSVNLDLDIENGIYFIELFVPPSGQKIVSKIIINR